MIRALLSDQVSIERQEGSIFDRSRGPHGATLRTFLHNLGKPRSKKKNFMECLENFDFGEMPRFPRASSKNEVSIG